MSDPVFTAYARDRDREAVRQIWREVGWSSSETHLDALDWFLESGHPTVALVDGRAECLVHWTPGRIRYQDHDVPLAAVTAVTTSRIARRQGLATRLTAQALQTAAESGAAVAVLGIFDQGFYDRLGFGTGSYDHIWTFDPQSLTVTAPYRPPVRLGVDDWEEIAACMTSRMRRHGEVSLDDPRIMRPEMEWRDNSFALGYRTEGELTHCLVGSAHGEAGPYRFDFMAYRSYPQLMELLRLLKELGDQVVSVTMTEPAGLQLQDLIDRPWRQRTRSRTSPHETINKAMGWWQVRILDPTPVVAARRWPGPEVRFGLTLTDPVSAYGWDGVGGDYVVTLGRESSIERGDDTSLPGLEASIGAFSRMWFGVRPATTLAVTDRLVGPAELLTDLDEALRLPTPVPGMEF